MTAHKAWTPAYELTRLWLTSAAAVDAASARTSGSGILNHLPPAPLASGGAAAAVDDNAALADGSIGSTISAAPSTLLLLDRLQREGATDELLMALMAVREASGAWPQAAAMFRWMQSTQATDFTRSKEAHTIVFEMLFTQVRGASQY